MSMLYICYLGMGEPLVHTQVIPYLEGLACAGYRVVLLTFEPTALSHDESMLTRERLRSRNVEWHSLRYHKRPALPATCADVATGIVYAAYLIRKRRIGVVHARGYVPAAIAAALKWLLGTRFVFDIRGLMAEEYVDAGLWKAGGLLYRLTKRMEALFLANADAVVVLTRRARQWVLEAGGLADSRPPVQIIPCCVDLQRFRIDPLRVELIRRDLGLVGRPVLVYAGKFGGWYMAGEMADFFRTARRYFPGLYFLVLTQSAPSIIEEEFARKRIDRDSYRSLRVSPEDLPAYLHLADFAISFRVPCLSQIAASPTKMAEYLAAGLPVVHNAGIGDLDELQSERVGVLIRAFSGSDYHRAARQMRVLLKDREATALRCRGAAQKHFSLATIGVPRYLELYSTLADQPIQGAQSGSCA